MALTSFAFILFLCPWLQAGESITYPDLLDQMTDMDQLWMPPLKGERCIQYSSYDRNSDQGVGIQEAKPWDPKGWYANTDRDWYMREEERNGAKEYVLAHAIGPGAVVRIWSANPTGTLFFYVDGAEEPTWSPGFKELTSGEVAPFSEPMAGIRGRGYNCHAPFPYKKQIKITCSHKDHHFQVNVRLFPRETQIDSFHPGMLVKYAGEIEAAKKAMLAPPAAGKVEVLEETGTLTMAGDPADPSDWAEKAITLQGPLVVREVALKITPAQASDLDYPNLLRRILFCVDLDHHRAVRVPVADFFASAPGFKPFRAYPMEVTEDSWGICRFPMPMKNLGVIALVADGPLPEVQYHFKIKTEKRSLPDHALAFRASWHLRKKVRTRPISDFRVLNAAGPGNFVGCFLAILNPSIYWWGEGDEKFFVDGEPFPSTFGTGTEDYFGYAWADTNPFFSPYHAQPQCDGPENAGYTCLNRFQILDRVPFQKSFLFDLEIWHWKDVYMDYAATAYWYGAPHASSGLPNMADHEYRSVTPWSPEPIFNARDALEGESLKVIALTKGKTETPLMGWYTDRKWSNEKQLFWCEGSPGDKLTLEIPVKEAGRYGVEAVFTRARDYGIIQVALNGKVLGEPVDLYLPNVVAPMKRITLGEAELEAGNLPLVIEITGKNPEAEARYLVGLDYLRLVRL